MDDHELIALMRSPESDRLERKESLHSASARDAVRQAICAFANDLPGSRQPGVVFVGVRDDGGCAGLRVDDQLLLTLADMRSDGRIVPLPSMEVRRHVQDGCEVAVAVVHPSYSPPVRFDGRVWVRVGPRRALATPDEEQRLNEKRRHLDLPHDVWPVPGTNEADLNLLLFQQSYLPAAVAPEVLEENRRTPSEQVASLRFLTSTGEATVLGILVLGTEPRRQVPGAYVQFVRFDGTELSDPVQDRKEVSGALPELLRRIDELLEAHITVATEVTSNPIEVRRADYPLAALQQLTRNAIMHRTYENTHAPVLIYWFDDRIEINSPGGPFGRVTAENFGRRGITDYRNPHLAEAMKTLGYVQRFGVGIEIARRELARNGSPQPEFEVEPSHVLAVVRRAP